MVFIISYHPDQLHQIRRTLGGDDAVLREMSTQCIHRLCPLTHQRLARPELDSGRLLRLGLGRYEAHCRTRHRLADRLSIHRVRLTAFDIGLNASSLARSDGNLRAGLLGPPFGRRSTAGLPPYSAGTCGRISGAGGGAVPSSDFPFSRVHWNTT
jgi:hypothetical protein